jgi:hypothetical protein
MLTQMLESMTTLHGNPGDYLRPGMTMDDLITQLMDQGHTSAPPPASTDAIDSLQRIKADKALVEGGKECTVCKENLALGEDVIRLPCLHVLYVPQPMTDIFVCFSVWVLTWCVVMKIALYPGSKSMDHVLYVVTPSTPIRHLPPMRDPLQTTILLPREEVRLQAPLISEQVLHHGYPTSLEVGAIRGVGTVIHHQNLGNGIEMILSLLRKRIWIKRFSSSLRSVVN